MAFKTEGEIIKWSDWLNRHMKQMESYPDVSANVQIKLMSAIESFIASKARYEYNSGFWFALQHLKKICAGKLKPEAVAWLKKAPDKGFALRVLHEMGEKVGDDIMIDALSRDSSDIKYIMDNIAPEPSEEFVKKILDAQGGLAYWAFLAIKKPGEKLMEYAIKKRPILIHHLKDPSVGLQKIAIAENPYTVCYDPGRRWKFAPEVIEYAKIAMAKTELDKAKTRHDHAKGAFKKSKSADDKSKVRNTRDGLRTASKGLKIAMSTSGLSRAQVKQIIESRRQNIA